jgi:hypothetical protein
MKGSDINKTIIIFILFGILYLVNILSAGIKKIKEQWPIYKCNPGIMPFAGIFGKEPISNFFDCIQNMQSLNMDFILQPVKNNISTLTEISETFNENLGGLRGFLNKFREKILSIAEMIYSVIGGIVTEFQKIIINIKDLISRIAGVLATILYSVETSYITAKSVVVLIKKLPFMKSRLEEEEE